MDSKVLEHGKCKYCGADNDTDKHPHIKIARTDCGYVAYCDNCRAQTDAWATPEAATYEWLLVLYTIPTQSERQIYEGAVNLMHGLVEDFKEWLEWQGVEVPEDEAFCVSVPPTSIVNKLFLWHTGHSGGTSTRAKCRELGIEDPTRTIEFTVREGE